MIENYKLLIGDYIEIKKMYDKINFRGGTAMKLYVIRHGESENNVNNCWTGWQNVNLTKKGISEAEKVGETIARVKFDKIYTSDLIRCVQTAQVALPRQKYHRRDNLREINIGSLSGLKFEDGAKLFGKALQENIKNLDYTDYSGENIKQIDKRVMSFLKEVTEDFKENMCENLAVFTHVGIIRRLCELLTDLSLPPEKAICQNCAIIIFDYNNDVWKLHSWINLV